MDDERERVWFEVTADIDPLSPILDWWVTVDRRIVGGGWPTWEDAPAATALRCVAAISGLMESWLHPAAASRYAPIRVEAGGLEGTVTPVAIGDGVWWVVWTDWYCDPPPTLVEDGVEHLLWMAEECMAAPDHAAHDWFFAAAAAVASWVAGGTD